MRKAECVFAVEYAVLCRVRAAKNCFAQKFDLRTLLSEEARWGRQ